MDTLKTKFEELYADKNIQESKIVNILINMFPEISRAKIEKAVSQWLLEKENEKKSKWDKRKAKLSDIASHPLSCSEESKEDSCKFS